MTALEEQLDYFIANQAELVREHDGKVLVISGREVVGVFDTALEAYLHAEARHEAGTYIVQECLAGSEAYTAHFASPFWVSDISAGLA